MGDKLKELVSTWQVWVVALVGAAAQWAFGFIDKIFGMF